MGNLPNLPILPPQSNRFDSGLVNTSNTSNNSKTSKPNKSNNMLHTVKIIHGNGSVEVVEGCSRAQWRNQVAYLKDGRVIAGGFVEGPLKPRSSTRKAITN